MTIMTKAHLTCYWCHNEVTHADIPRSYGGEHSHAPDCRLVAWFREPHSHYRYNNRPFTAEHNGGPIISLRAKHFSSKLAGPTGGWPRKAPANDWNPEGRSLRTWWKEWLRLAGGQYATFEIDRGELVYSYSVQSMRCNFRIHPRLIGIPALLSGIIQVSIDYRKESAA